MRPVRLPLTLAAGTTLGRIKKDPDFAKHRPLCVGADDLSGFHTDASGIFIRP